MVFNDWLGKQRKKHFLCSYSEWKWLSRSIRFADYYYYYTAHCQTFFFFFGEIQFLKKHQFHKVCWSDFPIVPIWAVWILFPNWLDYRSFAWSLLNKYAFIVYLHLQFTWQIFWSPYKFLCFCWCSRPYFNYRRLCCCCFCRFRLNRFVFHLALDRHSTLSLRSLIIARGAHLIAWHTY